MKRLIGNNHFLSVEALTGFDKACWTECLIEAQKKRVQGNGKLPAKFDQIYDDKSRTGDQS